MSLNMLLLMPLIQVKPTIWGDFWASLAGNITDFGRNFICPFAIAVLVIVLIVLVVKSIANNHQGMDINLWPILWVVVALLFVIWAQASDSLWNLFLT